mmetsp:Transcript_59539/g.126570  ORF Transcript_59539/g.126570 Transcript_59539/m.126570 type:complete len:314 (-) Transcript_59539:1089-2030(-)
MLGFTPVAPDGAGRNEGSETAVQRVVLAPKECVVQEALHVVPVAARDAPRLWHCRDNEGEAREGAEEVEPEGVRLAIFLLPGEERVRDDRGRPVRQDRVKPQHATADGGGAELGRDEPRDGTVRESEPGDDARAPDQGHRLLVAGVDELRLARLGHLRIFQPHREADGQEQQGNRHDSRARLEEESPPQFVHLEQDKGGDDEFDHAKNDRRRQQLCGDGVSILGRLLLVVVVKYLCKYHWSIIDNINMPTELFSNCKTGNYDGLPPIVRNGRAVVHHEEVHLPVLQRHALLVQPQHLGLDLRHPPRETLIVII